MSESLAPAIEVSRACLRFVCKKTHADKVQLIKMAGIEIVERVQMAELVLFDLESAKLDAGLKSAVLHFIPQEYFVPVLYTGERGEHHELEASLVDNSSRVDPALRVLLIAHARKKLYRIRAAA